VVDLTCRLEKGAKFADIVAAIKEAAAGDVNGVLDWTDEEVVSTDFVSCKSSSIFDVSASSPSGMPMTMTKEAPFGASLGLSDGKSQQPFGWHARRD
jgi:glyceraldehyde-3-phosphate dehydrogenase/erythrose-4-phosphate dehydrogenase